MWGPVDKTSKVKAKLVPVIRLPSKAPDKQTLERWQDANDLQQTRHGHAPARANAGETAAWSASEQRLADGANAVTGLEHNLLRTQLHYTETDPDTGTSSDDKRRRRRRARWHKR